MDTDRVKGAAKQAKGAVKEAWGKGHRRRQDRSGRQGRRGRGPRAECRRRCQGRDARCQGRVDRQGVNRGANTAPRQSDRSAARRVADLAYSAGWGYYPSGGLGLVLLIVIVLLSAGRI